MHLEAGLKALRARSRAIRGCSIATWDLRVGMHLETEMELISAKMSWQIKPASPVDLCVPGKANQYLNTSAVVQ